MFIYFLKRKDTRDFVTVFSPYIIFIIAVILIVLFNLYAKPKNVLKDPNSKIKDVNYNKVAGYSILYSLIFGFIEYITLRIMKQ